MPEAQRSKRIAGQPAWAWGAELGGALLLWWWYRRRQAAAAASSSVAGAPVTSSPISVASPSSGSSSPSTLAQWQTQALEWMVSTGGLDANQALNAISDFLSGNCVTSSGYSGLSGALGAIGLPPGITSYSPISVCGGSPAATPATTATGLGSNLIGAGYGTATPSSVVTTPSGKTFSQIESGAGLLSAINSGTPVYFFPSQGEPVPVSAAQAAQFAAPPGTNPYADTPTFLAA